MCSLHLNLVPDVVLMRGRCRGVNDRRLAVRDCGGFARGCLSVAVPHLKWPVKHAL